MLRLASLGIQVPGMETIPSVSVVRFGAFEVDFRTGELHKSGLKLKLQEQAFQVLTMLLERCGEMVTREELRQKLWPDGTFVDVDHSLNTAVNRLREVLGDSPTHPRFIETLPRRGYRFIAPVEGLGASVRPAEVARKPAAGVHRRNAWIAALTLIALVAVPLGLNVGGWRERLSRSFGGGASPGRIQSLAVLPLENLSGDRAQDSFADGMTEALIIELGKFSALRVISRQSVMQYKGTEKTVPEIARALNVDAVIEGSVRRVGDRVRISAQLIQAVPESHLWADSFERDFRDILALEAEMARAIASEIKVALTPEEQARLASARPVNPEAHELYLMGRHHLRKGTREGAEKAIRYFEDSIGKDANHAWPYAGIADAYIALTTSHMAPRQSMPKAESAAIKALELEPTLAEAHASLGYVRLVYHWDTAGAEEALRRALELNPSSAPAHLSYAAYLAVLGRHEQALREHRLAYRLDPLLSAVSYWGFYPLFVTRQYEEIISGAQKFLELEPTRGLTHTMLALAYSRQGRILEGMAEAEKGWELSESSIALVVLAETYALAGKRSQSQRVLADLLEMSERHYVCPYNIACVYLALGNKDKAFEFFHEAIEIRSD